MGFFGNIMLFLAGFLFVYFAVWQYHVLFILLFVIFIGVLFFAENKKVVYPIAGVIIAGLIQVYAFVTSFHLPLLG